MDAKTVIIALSIAGGGYHFWHQHQQAQQHHSILASADPSGFIALPPPSGVNPNKIVILAARNCPKAGARRARAMARALTVRHIPYALLDHINFDLSPDSQPEIPALNRVMNGPTPVVLIHGRGKANPTLDEVLAEYSGADSSTDLGDQGR